jgi:hypothetical protein
MEVLAVPVPLERLVERLVRPAPVLLVPGRTVQAEEIASDSFAVDAGGA